MARPIWKGAISFGLLYIPVELYPAQSNTALDLDMLDKRDFAPVGYKRYNKVTGKELRNEDIVKGYQYEKGEYVVLSEQDLKNANVKATQTVDILSFVDASEIAPSYFEQPYYLAPSKGGDKVYALLRETLQNAGKVGIAQIVIRTKQHLCALIPVGHGIVLNILRYESELRPVSELKLPETAGNVSAKEINMALALVEGMTEPWQPAQYRDSYQDDVLALVKKKVKAKQTKRAALPEDEHPAAAPTANNVVDLMQLLKQSIAKSKSAATAPTAPSKPASKLSKTDIKKTAKPIKQRA